VGRTSETECRLTVGSLRDTDAETDGSLTDAETDSEMTMTGLEELECFSDFVLIFVLEVLCELVVLALPVLCAFFLLLVEDFDIADATTVWEEVLLMCVDFDFVLCLALDLE